MENKGTLYLPRVRYRLELLIPSRSRLENGKFDSKWASSYQLPRMTFLNIFPSAFRFY